MRTIVTVFIGLLILSTGRAQTHPAIERFLSPVYMKGASLSFAVKEIQSNTFIYSYDAEREMIPASVLKIVTTATTLELLGEQFRYETSILYDGEIMDSTLVGNLYIRGSGDPSLGSSETGTDRNKVMYEWVKTIKNAGIRTINGSVIADESIFDTEGVSMKWLREDLGSYYGQGSYGLNIYDNRYTLLLSTALPDGKPEIIGSEPDIPNISYHNYLTTNKLGIDSTYIIGLPFVNERYLYGTVPSNRSEYRLRGDIPEPSLYLAQRLTELLKNDTVKVLGTPACYRILLQNNEWRTQERKLLVTTCSLPLRELVRITNHTSHNLYADALLKTAGLQNRTDELKSSLEKGIGVVKRHWEAKGLPVSALWMFDGSGLSPSDKTTASFLCDLLLYMYTQSPVSRSFIESLPRAGMEGTVANMLKGSVLQGQTRLKSGSMNRVRSYAGYVVKDNKTFAVAILVNNFSCSQTQIRQDIERLLLALF